MSALITAAVFFIIMRVFGAPLSLAFTLSVLAAIGVASS